MEDKNIKDRRGMIIEQLNLSIENDVDDWVDLKFPTPVKRFADIVNDKFDKWTSN